MASSPPSDRGSDSAPTRARSDSARLAAIAILLIVVVVFALLNLDQVKVDLLFGTAKLPLIVVIVACLLIGALIGAIWARRGRRG
jgi:uncharacterized integral membrane protein